MLVSASTYKGLATRSQTVYKKVLQCSNFLLLSVESICIFFDEN